MINDDDDRLYLNIWLNLLPRLTSDICQYLLLIFHSISVSQTGTRQVWEGGGGGGALEPVFNYTDTSIFDSDNSHDERQ